MALLDSFDHVRNTKPKESHSLFLRDVNMGVGVVVTGRQKAHIFLALGQLLLNRMNVFTAQTLLV